MKLELCSPTMGHHLVLLTFPIFDRTCGESFWDTPQCSSCTCRQFLASNSTYSEASVCSNIGEEQFPDLRDRPLDSIWCFMLHEELGFPWFPWRWVAFKAQTLGGDWIASPKLMDRQVRQNRTWRLMLRHPCLKLSVDFRVIKHHLHWIRWWFMSSRRWCS